MRVRLIEFDGTLEEYRGSGMQQVVSSDTKNSQGSNRILLEEHSPGEPTSLREDEGFLRRVLELRPLTPSLDKLLRLLLTAEPQRYVPRSEIGAALEYSQSQIDGVLGSLGRRVNETPRADMRTQLGIGELLDWERANGNGEWRYRLWPSFRRVLEAFYASR